MGRPIHFEIHGSDPERLAAFYRDLFGWTLQNWDGQAEYWMVMTGEDGTPGINGGLLRRHGSPPAEGQAVNAFVCTVEVPDIDAALDKAQSLGGTLALAKQPVPGIGWLAYVKDLDGNLVGMMQTDPAAA